MRLSTKMRYGTRALVELAVHYGQGELTLAEIAGAQGLPEKYLESLLGALHAAGFVRTQRGPKGGYALARSPERITLREVFDILEGSGPYVPCTQHDESCPRRAFCVTRGVWASMYRASMQVLESTTLASLAAECQPRTEGSAL